MIPRRRMLPALGAFGVGALAVPASASAHGIVGKADLPIPVWLFSWTAAIVLVVSFVALSTLWTRPQLQGQRARRLARVPRVLEWLAGLIGVALFTLVLYSGFAGAQVPNANFSVTFVYVVFWVGVPLLSVLFGDVFRAFSPWRAVARLICALRTRLGAHGAGAPLRYPARLGAWPAFVGLVGFAWLELVYVNRDDPSTLAALSLGYFLVMVAGMVLCGVQEWESRADGFGVYFNLLSRLAALDWRERAVYLRRPLSAITDLELAPGMVALMCAIIGTTTFDGLSNGGVWRSAEPHLQSVFADIGLAATPALELTYSLGLLLSIGLIAAIYRLGVLGVRSVNPSHGVGELTRAFAHTLVPIGFAYVLAHYFSLLLWQGQAIGYLASDPLGDGSNLLGTSSYEIDYQVISYAAIWYVQVAALIVGHVSGLALAHDRALVIYRDAREAVRSQYWMLAVMVAFTSFGLWLLSAVGT
ncbi:MAG TPA: fenitrothion hydrolase [Solirubrobacteraceae bacterium]|nr:fenitrothion hydrolase [Solirubrobacteraceae bacterium]